MTNKTTTLKGYKLSNDHEKLYDLLTAGYQIPIVIQHPLFDNKSFTFGKKLNNGALLIDADICYIRTDDKPTFIKECKYHNIHFIPHVES